MALPHYNLPTPNQTIGMESFPVVMVPNDGTARASHLKELFFSRKTQAITALLCMSAVATALWIYFEPTNAFISAKNSSAMLMASLAVAAVTLILLGIAAVYKLQSRDSFTTPPETISLPANREAVTVRNQTASSSIESAVIAFERHKRIASEQTTAVEFLCEDFVSEPFIEFLDESVIAEVFSDEMIAPDCLVFSIEVKENVTQ